MKLCVGKIVKSDKSIFTFRVGIWEAAKWSINNTSLEKTLTDKAFTAAGIPPLSPMHDIELTFFGAPDYQYDAKIYSYKWEEVTK